MVKWQEGNLIQDKETNKNNLNLPKNTRNGPLNNGRIYYGAMKTNETKKKKKKKKFFLALNN